MSFRVVKKPESDLTVWFTEKVVVVGRQQDLSLLETIKESFQFPVDLYDDWKKFFFDMSELYYVPRGLSLKNKIESDCYDYTFRAFPRKNFWILSQETFATIEPRTLILDMDECRFLSLLFMNPPTVEEDWRPVDMQKIRDFAISERLRANETRAQTLLKRQEHERLASLTEELNLHRNNFETLYDALTQIKSIRIRCKNRHGGTLKSWIRIKDEPPTEINQIGILIIKCSVCGHQKEIHYRLNRIPGKKEQQNQLWEVVEENN